MIYSVYFLQSLKNNRRYIGVTSDLAKRLKRHNSGQVRSTKAYLPWKIVYKEEFSTKNDAYKREYYLKSTKGYLEKQKILNVLDIHN